MRISPDEYFVLERSNEFKEGLKFGAFIMVVGIIMGALIVYLARR